MVGPVAGTPAIAYRLSEISGPRLLPGSLALAIGETAVVGGNRKTRTGMAIYQTDGNTLSAVYAWGSNLTAIRAMALQAAERSAHNLRGA